MTELPAKLNIQPNVPLAPLTTFGVGGAAAYFCKVEERSHLESVLAWARDKKLPVVALGGGSNVVVSDDGFKGLAVLIRLHGIEGEVRGSRALLTAAAGEPWDNVVKYAVEHDWAGIENLSGIPGSTGGAVVQNINAYGQVMSDTVREVEALEVATGQLKRFNNAACKFAYRDSYFKHAAVGEYVITSVTMQLTVHGKAELSYQSMHGSLAAQLGTALPTLKTMRQTVLTVRNKKGHVLLEGFDRFRSVGSFFTNPIVSAGQFERVLTIVQERDASKEERLRPWFWKMPDGRVKISAAFLIEWTSFTKGLKRGAVGISPRHILSLVTYPGATAAELIALARDIQAQVKKIFGIILESEAQLVGFDPYSLLQKTDD